MRFKWRQASAVSDQAGDWSGQASKHPKHSATDKLAATDTVSRRRQKLITLEKTKQMNKSSTSKT